MTEQLQAALDALNACPDADAVADLLRRHGIRATEERGAPGAARSCHCPVSVYLKTVGGAENPAVGYAVVLIDKQYHYLSVGPCLFIAVQDEDSRYPDLEAA